jgi:hypothetical protein
VGGLFSDFEAVRTASNDRDAPRRYSALLVFNILRHADKIPSKEWGLFVRGPGIVDRESQPTNPKPEKIPEASWDLLCAAEFNLEEVNG